MISQVKKVILLVEDDIFIGVVEKKIINRLGYEVIIANSGEMAVEMALNNEKIDLILMDINLGQGIDGPEAAEEILRKKNIPIVFVAADSEKEYANKLKGIPCYGCVLKASGEFVLNSSIEIALELFREKKNLQKKVDLLCQERYWNLAAAKSNTFLDNQEKGARCQQLNLPPMRQYT
jgi:CheY-like chemotaxis protein